MKLWWSALFGAALMVGASPATAAPTTIGSDLSAPAKIPPLAGTGTSTDDVFLNLGRNYPDPERFTIVLWDVGGIDAPPVGKTLCATGQITAYRGVAEIELRSADDVEALE